MPADTLEEIRLLYNLESTRHKLLKIALFGQSELDTILSLPNMRQLKDRITHHFTTQPFSVEAVNEYLMFRMRAAGYHGPDNFTPEAVNLIAKASGGLTRRVNIYADKSLLAAFIDNTHSITVTHVKAAIEDSNPRHDRRWLDRLAERRNSAAPNWLNYWIVGAAALIIGGILGGRFGW
jgi:type II secretory pathway predicted ATPase ExeA